MNKFFLLTDDDKDDAELFSEALSRISPPVDFYHVEQGAALFEFLDNKENRRPELIFLDINMPELSGWQCLVQLKRHAEHKAIPVIMYSTSSHPRDREIAGQLGALGFLTKPFDFKSLIRILTSIAKTETEELEKVFPEIANEQVS